MQLIPSNDLGRMVLLIALSGVMAACAPSLAPKYGDYRLDVGEPTRDETNLHFTEEDGKDGGKDESFSDSSLTVKRLGSRDGLTDTDILEDVASVLEASGWVLRDADVVEAVATQPRKFANWLFYSVHAELEVVVIGDRYVRLFVHPWRHYWWGSWGRIPYLKTGLAVAVFESVDEAFQEAGYEFIGNAPMRDRENMSEKQRD